MIFSKFGRFVMPSVKKWVGYGIALVAVVIIVELTSSAFLFEYYAYKQSSFSPEGTAIGFIAKKALRIHPVVAFEADKPDMFRPDPVLGYTTNPGKYRIIATNGAKKHGYQITVTEPGVRATSYRSFPASRRIYIFGNSIIWANGLDDELTVPWLLQTRLPDYEVINLALSGYSNVQQLLGYRNISAQLRPDDIVVFQYGSFDLLANVADPGTTIKALSDGYEMALSNKADFRNVRIPYATLDDQNELNIEYAPIVCASNNCNRDIPKGEAREAITNKVMAEIVRNRKCHILVAFMEGNDDDPVVAFLRSSGVPIADLRIVKPGLDDDDYLPEHDHRGAFTNFHYYEVLLKALKSQMLDATR
jgi:hypothetical protein